MIALTCLYVKSTCVYCALTAFSGLLDLENEVGWSLLSLEGS